MFHRTFFPRAGLDLDFRHLVEENRCRYPGQGGCWPEIPSQMSDRLELRTKWAGDLKKLASPGSSIALNVTCGVESMRFRHCCMHRNWSAMFHRSFFPWADLDLDFRQLVEENR